MIPNKFVYFSQGSSYRSNRDDDNIKDDSIVFVEDDMSISTRGKIFGNRGIYIGTCTTAAATPGKVATVSPFPLDANNKPLVGTVVGVKYSYSNSYKTAGTTHTLDVNGTGAYPMYYNNAELVSTTSANTMVAGYKNRYIYYMFNGTQWVWLTGSYDANTTYTNVSLGQGYAVQNNETASATITATLSSYALTTGGIVAVKFNFNVPANSTLNINDKGAKSIYFKGSAITEGIIKAGDIATFIYSTNYHLLAIDRWDDDIKQKADIDSPTFTGTPTAPTAATGTNTTQIATTAFVKAAIDALPEPMVFKGSLGTGGTITSLPTNGTATVGDTYKVITAGTYAGISADIGDTFICLTKTSNSNTWELIPSGDEPSGTVTSVGLSVPTGLSVSGSPITSSGTLEVTFTSGYSIPTTAKQGNWDTAYTNNHTHSNKSVLDDISSNDISNWNSKLSQHQSIKSLNTDNSTTQSTNSSESITGSGTINLHKVSKTGSYNDLLDKPTIPAAATVTTSAITNLTDIL